MENMLLSKDVLFFNGSIHQIFKAQQEFALKGGQELTHIRKWVGLVLCLFAPRLPAGIKDAWLMWYGVTIQYGEWNQL
jgi:hypothetical protein